ncbi:MAG: SDR family oxidoreductase [Rhodospirillaceae bacterium]|nr:SDR family oxidoreductase [Rhodospirillaceae bacterium]
MWLVFGLGYSGRAFAQRAQARGARVVGTVRDPARAPGDGIPRLGFDASSDLAAVEAMLREATYVLVSIPPIDRDGGAGHSRDLVLARLGAAIAAAPHLVWLGYLSTTGVYGDRGGDWVDETSARRPGNARSVARAAAEDAWLALWRDRGVPAHIFRLPGIYGPGRSAADQLRAGTAKRIDKHGQIFSRIHVEDIAGALEASAARPRPGAIYNVADDLPSSAADVVAHAAALLGVAPPLLEPYDPARMAPMAREFYAESRRVSNARLKRELGYALRYPDYRAGLAAILAKQR